MAIFLPALNLLNPHSSAESKVLHWLRGLCDDWYVLHSVGIGGHAAKPWAEADVVLVGSLGILVLEVKGGRVERRNGMWGFRDRRDQVTWKREGPYEQVGGATAALRRHLQDSDALADDVLVGWAVLFPDAQVSGVGSESDPALTLDASRPWAEPERELTDIAEHWRRRLGPRRALGPMDVRRVVAAIRGDLSAGPDLRQAAAEVTALQRRLTVEQWRIVDAAKSNERLLLEGPAGTGMWVLALHQARTMACTGTSVALVTPTAPLAQQASAVLEDSGVVVLHLETARETGLQFKALVVAGAEHLPGDAIGILDRLLVGGLAGGCWRVFLDPSSGALGGSDVRSAYRRFAPAELVLRRNCRSTRQILTTSSMLTRVPLDIETGVLGPDVRLVWWSDADEHDSLLTDILASKVEDFRPESVAVINSRDLADKRFVDIDESIAALGDGASMNNMGIVVADVDSVIGIEPVSMVIPGISSLSSPGMKRLLYVACAAARLDVSLFLHVSLRPDVEASAVRLGKWVASRRSPTSCHSVVVGAEQAAPSRLAVVDDVEPGEHRAMVGDRLFR